MLLPTTNIYPAQNVNSAEVRNPGLEERPESITVETAKNWSLHHPVRENCFFHSSHFDQANQKIKGREYSLQRMIKRKWNTILRLKSSKHFCVNSPSHILPMPSLCNGEWGLSFTTEWVWELKKQHLWSNCLPLTAQRWTASISTSVFIFTVCEFVGVLCVITSMTTLQDTELSFK